jgi:hypothetical protein
MKKYFVPSLTMKRLFPLSLLAAGLLITPLRANTNLVANGSFEDAANGAYTTSGSYEAVGAAGSGYPYTTGANTTLITGWTATAIAQGGYYGLVNKNVFSPSEATTGDEQGLFILDYFNSGVGTLISNSVGTITANTTYTLSLDIGAPSSFSLRGTPRARRRRR